MCKALMTGHDGSMTTIHAEDAELALDQAVQYVMENRRFTGNEKMAKRVVEHAIHLVIHLANQDGRRRLTGRPGRGARGQPQVGVPSDGQRRLAADDRADRQPQPARAAARAFSWGRRSRLHDPVAASSAVQFAGLLLFACAAGGAAAILDLDARGSAGAAAALAVARTRAGRRRDLGWYWRTMVALRMALVVAGWVSGLCRASGLVIFGACGLWVPLCPRRGGGEPAARVERAFLPTSRPPRPHGGGQSVARHRPAGDRSRPRPGLEYSSHLSRAAVRSPTTSWRSGCGPARGRGVRVCRADVDAEPQPRRPHRGDRRAAAPRRRGPARRSGGVPR